jgi:hypothetical protein
VQPLELQAGPAQARIKLALQPLVPKEQLQIQLEPVLLEQAPDQSPQ